MRELAVRIRFTAYCLGNVQRSYRDDKKKRLHWLLPRNGEGRVTFMQTWWWAVLFKGADVLCRHHSEIRKIRFAPELIGEPQPLPAGYYQHFYGKGRFSRHEAFHPGDVVGLTCAVPDSISDEDFHLLLTYAGKYSGISPAHSGEYGFFVVDTIRQMRGGVLEQPEEIERVEEKRPPVPTRPTA